MRAMPSIVIVFFQFDIERVGARDDAGGFLAMIMIVVVTMVVVMPAGQQPRARDIDHQAKGSDRDRLVEADGNRIEQARYGFIADQ